MKQQVEKSNHKKVQYSEDVEGRVENSARVKHEVETWNMDVKVSLGWIQELWEAQILAFIMLRGHIAD